MLFGFLRTHVAKPGDSEIVRRLEDRGVQLPRARTVSELRQEFLALPEASAPLPETDPALVFVPPWGFFAPSTFEDEDLGNDCALIFPPFMSTTNLVLE
jgi:hypothetical protein